MMNRVLRLFVVALGAVSRLEGQAPPSPDRVAIADAALQGIRPELPDRPLRLVETRSLGDVTTALASRHSLQVIARSEMFDCSAHPECRMKDGVVAIESGQWR
jgi:hypothetical protein